MWVRLGSAVRSFLVRNFERDISCTDRKILCGKLFFGHLRSDNLPPYRPRSLQLFCCCLFDVSSPKLLMLPFPAIIRRNLPRSQWLKGYTELFLCYAWKLQKNTCLTTKNGYLLLILHLTPLNGDFFFFYEWAHYTRSTCNFDPKAMAIQSGCAIDHCS
jgi:hypothetical protein